MHYREAPKFVKNFLNRGEVASLVKENGALQPSIELTIDSHIFFRHIYFACFRGASSQNPLKIGNRREPFAKGEGHACVSG